MVTPPLPVEPRRSVVFERGFKRFGWIPVAIGCLIASCGGETGVNPQPGSPDTTSIDSTLCVNVEITVSSGTTPTFSWMPDCPVGVFVVEDDLMNETWAPETAGPNTYHSPIVYDVNPPDTFQPEAAFPLVAGKTYTVSIFRWVTVVPESLQLVATKTFTP
jgi:hypothetical protein